MASGNTLDIFTPLGNEPPASNYATLDTRNQHPCLDFDDTTSESAQWTSFIPRNYSGGGVTLTIVCAASTATTGAAVLNGAFERLEVSGTSVAGDNFGSTVSVVVSVPGSAGILQYSTLAFTSGALMDSVSAGEMYRLRVSRVVGDASDNMTGDLELYAIEMRET